VKDVTSIPRVKLAANAGGNGVTAAEPPAAGNPEEGGLKGVGVCVEAPVEKRRRKKDDLLADVVADKTGDVVADKTGDVVADKTGDSGIDGDVVVSKVARVV
jgi:hypothetical protein